VGRAKALVERSGTPRGPRESVGRTVSRGARPGRSARRTVSRAGPGGQSVRPTLANPCRPSAKRSRRGQTTARGQRSPLGWLGVRARPRRSRWRDALATGSTPRAAIDERFRPGPAQAASDTSDWPRGPDRVSSNDGSLARVRGPLAERSAIAWRVGGTPAGALAKRSGPVARAARALDDRSPRGRAGTRSDSLGCASASALNGSARRTVLRQSWPDQASPSRGHSPAINPRSHSTRSARPRVCPRR
jgi:hypothetical protein